MMCAEDKSFGIICSVHGFMDKSDWNQYAISSLSNVKSVVEDQRMQSVPYFSLAICALLLSALLPRLFKAP